MKKVERWKVEMPSEAEMLAKDKYTVFDRKVKRYRKGIHSEWSPFLFCCWFYAAWWRERESGRGRERRGL